MRMQENTMMRAIAVGVLVVSATLGGGKQETPRHAEETAPAATEPAGLQIGNAAYRLTVTQARNEVRIKLWDVAMGFAWSDGPYRYTARRRTGAKDADFTGVTSVTLRQSGDSIRIEGELAGLRLRHTFTLPAGRPFLEENLIVSNPTGAGITLADLQTSFQRLVTDAAGNVLPAFSRDRLIAVPFRHRADDPPDYFNDFSINDVITTPGYEISINESLEYQRRPSPYRHAEGWCWKHGAHCLGIFSFNQDNMNFSLISPQSASPGAMLNFGGFGMYMKEPADLTRIEPGRSVNLGLVRYQSIKGDYNDTLYAFRRMLDEKGCRFPDGFNPPVHWNQLYNMWGAWDDRQNKYTRALVEQEAAQARDYGCESLYLDPGWDTLFGSFLWGEKWLGPRRTFIRDIKAKYGLHVSLHCPLATWMSSGGPMGPDAVAVWPAAARRILPAEDADLEEIKVPAHLDRHRNLALLPAARASASSVIEGYAIHKIEHLNDGWLGNRASWIAGSMPAWAEIDLGQVYEIHEVRLCNDRLLEHRDRQSAQLRILVATDYDADTAANSWKTVAEYKGDGFTGLKEFVFEPARARWVRIDLAQSTPGKTPEAAPRLDEIEVFEARPTPANDIPAVEAAARRGPGPSRTAAIRLCLGSKQYLDEAEKRLLANCADGAVYLMYDGNWWSGGCDNPEHGHPIPYLMEDHIRANLDLARRVHARYPEVLIEMHDMLAGGSTHRITPVYYKYGLPGSYDDNWGFELMWSPLEDIKERRCLALYYYDMGCNVPLYLHVNLSTDNEHCLVLWWYASTCRHLGIGGTHPDPKIVRAQQEGMRKYRALERFYKRGDFYGISEEIHLHALPRENAFVVNLFNLSDRTRTIEGSIPLVRMGIDPGRQYAGDSQIGKVDAATGVFSVSCQLPAWGTEMVAVSPAQSEP
jgi:hypothetical protein